MAGMRGDDDSNAVLAPCPGCGALFLNIHGIISGHTTRHGWALGGALRIRGLFHKLTPPALGSGLDVNSSLHRGAVV